MLLHVGLLEREVHAARDGRKEHVQRPGIDPEAAPLSEGDHGHPKKADHDTGPSSAVEAFTEEGGRQ
jgi:hypothetical protein